MPPASNDSRQNSRFPATKSPLSQQLGVSLETLAKTKKKGKNATAKEDEVAKIEAKAIPDDV
jgi:hypothetical protein